MKIIFSALVLLVSTQVFAQSSTLTCELTLQKVVLESGDREAGPLIVIAQNSEQLSKTNVAVAGHDTDRSHTFSARYVNDIVELEIRDFSFLKYSSEMPAIIEKQSKKFQNGEAKMTLEFENALGETTIEALTCHLRNISTTH
jgi:hypothetical protein